MGFYNYYSLEEKIKKELLVDLNKLMKSDIKDKSGIKEKIINQFINDCIILYPSNNKEKIISIINNVVDKEIEKKQSNTGINDYNYEDSDSSINSELEKIVIKEIKERVSKCDKEEDLSEAQDDILKTIYEKYPEVDKGFALSIVSKNIKRQWMEVKYVRPLIELELYPYIALQDEATRKDIVSKKRNNRAKMVVNFTKEIQKIHFPEESTYEVRKAVMETLYEVEKVEKRGVYFTLDEDKIKEETKINEEELERDED